MLFVKSTEVPTEGITMTLDNDPAESLSSELIATRHMVEGTPGTGGRLGLLSALSKFTEMGFELVAALNRHSTVTAEHTAALKQNSSLLSEHNGALHNHTRSLQDHVPALGSHAHALNMQSGRY